MLAESGGEPVLSASPHSARGEQRPLARKLGPSAHEPDPILISSGDELQSLLVELTGDRAYPVIALPVEEDSGEPLLAPTEIRAIVGSNARIYLIADTDGLAQLQSVLGPKLALARDSVRIWFRGLSPRSDPADHPLIHVLQDESAAHTLAELARVFALSQPHVRREIKLISDAQALAEHHLDRITGLYAETTELLRDAHRERHEEAIRADAAEQLLVSAARSLAEMDGEERLHTLITREWLSALDASERREHPVAAYVLASSLVAMLETEPIAVQEHVARSCAMLACGRATSTAALGEPQFAGFDGAELQPTDDAMSVLCSLRPGGAVGPWLCYLRQDDGTIEIDWVGEDPRPPVS